MDKRVVDSTRLTQEDLRLLQRIEAGIPITADVSRADILLCILHDDEHIVVAAHGLPHSISSLYRTSAEGRLLPHAEQPLILRALQSGSGGRRRREVIRSGAPIIQEVYPIANRNGAIIAAFVVETTLIAHERQKRRDRHFQQAVQYLLEQCARGEMESAAQLTPFGLYDGVYVVDRTRNVTYMSGIAANMYRGIGVPAVLHDQPLDELEAADREMVSEAFANAICEEDLYDGEDGRTWIRRTIPLTVYGSGLLAGWVPEWVSSSRPRVPASSEPGEGKRRIDLVMMLLHNATETVAKQRELNVKAALVKEVHHRVKNNLQNIAAILRMQARRSQSDETQVALTDAVNRVLSMSVIHEYLSQGDSRSINVRDVCARIAQQVKEVALAPDQQIDIQVQGPAIRLPASQATPTALVINELLLNALEHGMKNRARGIINVTLADQGDMVSIEVADDGAGLPPGFQQSLQGGGGSLGLQIVHTLVTDDLKGSLVYESAGTDETGNEQGARVLVNFPKRPITSDG